MLGASVMDTEKIITNCVDVRTNPAYPLRMSERTTTQRLLSVIQPFAVRRLQRNIRQWLPAACKDSKGIEAEFVAKWSQELRFVYGL